MWNRGLYPLSPSAPGLAELRDPVWGCLWREVGRACALRGCGGGFGKCCVLESILCAQLVGCKGCAQKSEKAGFYVYPH